MTPWTEENTEHLRALWADGLSCSKIAKVLGSGITRNSVISKAHRLNLDGRSTKPSTTRKVPERRTPPKPRLVVVKSDEPAPPFLCQPETFPAGPGCRYTPDDVSQPGWVMCGAAPYKTGSPWCEFHAFKGPRPIFDMTRTQASQKSGAAAEKNRAAQDAAMRKVGLA